MESIYRTLYFCQKTDDVYKVFYGHTIYWKLTPLDYVIEGWRKKNIQGDMHVFFSDLPNEAIIDQFLNEKNIEIESNSKKYTLIFDWEQNDSDFIINEYSKDEYKPFISLCTKANYYFSETDVEFVDSFFQTKKEAILIFEKEFFVPLTNNPHLINTFAVYSPTRIETSIKNIRDDNNLITGIRFIINDTFHEYQECEANFLLTSDENKEEGSFKLQNIPDNIRTSFDPDYMELTIKDGENTVFVEKCSFIKSISINMNISSGSIKTTSGSVPVYSSSSFTVGNDHG